MKHPKGGQVVIACAQKIEGVPETIRLIPLGQVRSQKGDFQVDEESYREICRFAQGRGIDMVIDYEHQTLGGMQAPAAGWIKALSLSDDAICGQVEWTPKATEYLKNGEYRYLSPVVLLRDHKAVRLFSAGLTNTPAIDGMLPIANKFGMDDEGEDFMDLLQKLAALLGLPEAETEDEVTASIKRLTEVAKAAREEKTGGETVANKTVLSLLSLKAEATTAEVAAEIVKLQNQCNTSAHKLAEQESAGLVELALKEGKITPAQKEWAAQYALSDKSGFAEFLSKAAPTVPLGKVALSFKPQRGGGEIDGEIARQLGLTPDHIHKYGKKDEA